ADVLSLRVHSFGTIEFLTRIPLSAQAGIMGDVINFFLVTLVFGVLTYFIANFMIKKFKYATPGRLGNYEEGLGAEQADKAADGQTSAIASNASEQQIADVIYLLGDRKSTRLNSSHVSISYAVFCLKKKTQEKHTKY